MTETASLNITVSAVRDAQGWTLRAQIPGPDGDAVIAYSKVAEGETAEQVLRDNPEAVISAIVGAVRSPWGFQQPAEDPGYEHL